MSRLSYTILLLMAGLFISSCKKNPSRSDTDSDINSVAGLEVKELNFNYFSSKAKIDFDNDKMNVNGKSIIRIQRDEVIWISVMATALNLEVARCMITKDSIQAIDNFNKKYYSYDFNTLSARSGLQLDFKLVQSILLGNLTLLPGTERKLRMEGTHQILSLLGPQILVENFIDQGNSKPDKVIVDDLSSNSRLTIIYQDFGDLSGQLFPFTSNIKAVTDSDGKLSETSVKIQHQRVELSETPLSFPFNIPDSYEGN